MPFTTDDPQDEGEDDVDMHADVRPRMPVVPYADSAQFEDGAGRDRDRERAGVRRGERRRELSESLEQRSR